MNRRQAQRSLADLIAKCEAAHIQLPQDPFAARAEAVEAIIHSGKNGKVNLSDAQEELMQKFGVDPAWKQQLEEEDNKRQRRRAAHQKKGTYHGKAATKTAQESRGGEFLPDPPASDDSPQQETPSSAQKRHAVQDTARTPKTSTPKKRLMATAQTPVFIRPSPYPSQPSLASTDTISPKLPSDEKDLPYSLTKKTAKKAKSSRSLIVPGPPAEETEDKRPASVKKPGGDAALLDSDDDQEIIELLEEVEDAEVPSDQSSDEDFTL